MVDTADCGFGSGVSEGHKLSPLGSPNRSDGLERIVSQYIATWRAPLARYLAFLGSQRNLRDAIEVAALAKLPNGKRHPHQRRIPNKALLEARDRLLSVDLLECTDFCRLMDVVDEQIGDIKGIGRLTVYDTALRLGAYLGVSPSLVYLHAGTTEGARALGMDATPETVRLQELPEAFHVLSPAEAEDCLCIYKDELRALACT